MSIIIYHLFSQVEIKKWRQKLLKENKGNCALTGLPLSEKDAVLDHSHSTHHVRGVIHRQANAVLGKIENLWTRYLRWWYPGTLTQFLRQCADYLDKGHRHDIVHTGWIKGMQTRFNALSEGQKILVLRSMGLEEGTNSKTRKEIFVKGLRSKKFTLKQVQGFINQFKE